MVTASDFLIRGLWTIDRPAVFWSGCLAASLVVVAPFSLWAESNPHVPPSPLAGRGLVAGIPYDEAERAELDRLTETMERFAEQVREYRRAAQVVVEHRYRTKRERLASSYEAQIVQLEGEERRRRATAIEKLETFLHKHPDDARFTPDAIFRLAELYFERSYDEYYQARQVYDRDMESWNPDTSPQLPDEPLVHYEPTIAMMQRLLTEFPNYRLVDGAYYLLGYCLSEQGEEERAVDVFIELVTIHPGSRFAPEVWTRIGEAYFAANELELALEAYTRVLGHRDSPYYDKAMYKLAWTHYRLADPERSPEEFQKAVDTFVELLEFNEQTRQQGRERGGELRKEAIQYVAICYADETWGSLDRAITYLESKGRPPYSREILVAIGDIHADQTRFDVAVRAYQLAQERYPDHVEAPGVQEKIVMALERTRDFEAAALARDFLGTSYARGSPWYEKHKGDEAVIKNTMELLKKSLHSAALFHHRQAQVYKEANKAELAKIEYHKAATSYGSYLKHFPDDLQAYELSFYHAEALYYAQQYQQAAAQYEAVRDSNNDDKFRETAGFSVILSREMAVRVAQDEGKIPALRILRSTDRPPDEALAAQEIPDLRQKILDASDRYAAVAATSDKLPNVLYKAAEILYAYDHLPEARARFEALLAAYPEHEVAEFSANLIIESYLAEKNFAAVETFSRGLLERPTAPGSREFKAELVKFKTGALFKLAEELDTKGDWEKAAELYLKLVEENPKTQFADSALNNAAVNYERVRRFDSASKLYERLAKDYPQSPLADTALFRVGLNAERFFDFDKATQAYLRLVKHHPKSERRADAIYNTALCLENSQKYEQAAEQYLRYCRLFPDRTDAPEVCFRAGLVYEKMGDPRRVISSYRDYIRRYRHNSAFAEQVVHAYLKIGQANDKLGSERDASASYELAVQAFAHLADPEKAAPFAAEAQFHLVERQFAGFTKIQIVGDGKEQQRALKHKAEVLKKIEADYQEILNFKQIDWTLASLFRIGQLYQDMADRIVNAPCPSDVKRQARRLRIPIEEVCSEYRAVLEDKAANVEDKAVAAFETTIARARTLQVANEWTKKTLVALNRLRSKAWPLQKDAKRFVEEDSIVPALVVDVHGLPPTTKTGLPADAEPRPATEPPAVPSEPAAPDPASSPSAPISLGFDPCAGRGRT